MNNSEILDKIKKLLRLGQSPNQHEAELAVQRAFELASRHQIDIEAIDLESDVRKVVSEKFLSPSRLSFARKKILNLLSMYFNVNIVSMPRPKWMGDSHVVFIGKTIDIQIARYVYDYLHTACAGALKAFCNSRRKRPAASTQKNFVLGFVCGIASNLRAARAELSEHANALIVSEDARREAAQSSLFDRSKLSPVKSDLARRDQAAIHAGFVEGQNVQIRKPLESNAAGQLLLV